jgi:MFS family permease
VLIIIFYSLGIIEWNNLGYLGGCNCGLLVGWLSPALPQLRAPPMPLGEISVEQSAWLAAAFPISQLFAPIATFLADRYGRKKCIIFSSIPFGVRQTFINRNILKCASIVYYYFS